MNLPFHCFQTHPNASEQVQAHPQTCENLKSNWKYLRTVWKRWTKNPDSEFPMWGRGKNCDPYMIGNNIRTFSKFLAMGPTDAQKKILEMIAHASAINSVQKSSKSEQSSRNFGRLTFFFQKKITSLGCEPHEQKYEAIKSTASARNLFWGAQRV